MVVLERLYIKCLSNIYEIGSFSYNTFECSLPLLCFAHSPLGWPPLLQIHAFVPEIPPYSITKVIISRYDIIIQFTSF